MTRRHRAFIKARNRIALSSLLVCALGLSNQSAKADVGPPVGIKNLGKEAVAVAGEEYEGQFEIRVHREGQLSGLCIEGKGWEIKSSTLPKGPIQAEAGTLLVKFVATPADPDAPIGLSLRYNGRPVHRSFNVGPTHAARKAQPRPLVRAPDSTGLRPAQTIPLEPPTESAPRSAGGAVPIQVVGRVVYDRPGMDNSNPPDGDVDDPGDVPPAVVGADFMRVQLLDKDVFDHEIIWDGYTDEHGYFDSGTVWWDDCDITGCDEPDFVLRVAAFSGDTVLVQNTDDEIYEYFQPERENSTETFIDYGVLRPPGGQEPVFHIHNTIRKAKRFTTEEIGMPADGVYVYWPDDSKGDAAWYNPGEIAIHISTARQWRTDTIIHEYGHHHNNHFYGTARPDPSYCDPEMDCDDDPANNNCGHCMWCDENAVDAWFEGWANWFADVVTRHYPERYTNEDGTPFLPLFTRDQESPGTCGGSYDDRLTTEGFVGALLRDIEDETPDDHDDDPDPENVITDGVFDSMCVGAGKVAFITYAHDPMTVTEFLSGYLSSFPEETHLLWPTAFNVGASDYVSMFPSDTQPPAVVTALDSPSHPLGQGGGLACMTFAVQPPDDDVRGSNFYSYVVSDDPNGVEPDEGADPVKAGAPCGIEFTVPIYELGEYYVSIKAQDNAGHWSSQWDTFGPFEVLDCNNSGQLDICDIDCRVTSIPGLCDFGISPCGSVFSCTENASDCNGNWEPDICDVTSLRSEDCDVNGVPDECQSMKHYTGGKGNPDQNKWEEPENWKENQMPADQDYVCVPADSDGNAVVYKQDDTIVSSLAVYKDFVISSDDDHPDPDLGLLYNSFVLGDFEMSGSSSITVNDRLYVDGKFFWHGGSINGNGVVDVSDGLSLTPSGVDLNGARFLLRSGDVDTSTLVNMRYGATFQIDPNANYHYSGDYYFFYGSNGKVTVRGNLTREAGDATATAFTPLDNEGTVHVKTGELYLAYPGTHSGQFICDAGTQLTLSANGGAQEFLPASSISTPTLEFTGGTGNIHGTVDIAEGIVGRGGTWTFAADAHIVDYGDEVFVDRGRINFDAPPDQPIDLATVTITSPGEGSGSVDFDTGQPVNVETFTMITGGLYGSSPINVSGTFNWRNGSIQPGGAITANGPVVISATSSSRTLSRVLNINDQASVFSGFSLGGDAVINIGQNVLFNMQFDHGTIGSRTINNFGTILRSSGTGVAGFSAALNNAGLVHNQTGTLNVGGGGTHTGDLLADPGTVLQIGGSGHDFQTSSTITASDLLLTASNSSAHGSVNVADTIECDGCNWTFASDANIISYGDNVVIGKGTLHFDAPTDRAVDLDTIDIQPNFNGYSLYFDTGQPVNINTLTMANGGSIYGSSPINVATQFTWTTGSIQSGGRIRCDGNTTVNATSSQRDLRRPLDNYGTLTAKGGFGSNASSPITNKPGAVMDLQYQNSSIGLTGTIHNEGTMLKTTTAGAAGLPNVVNTGIIDVQMGSIQFHTSYGDFVQKAGETILDDTSIEMFGDGAPIHLEGGLLHGNGSIIGDIDNSGGTVSPGFSVGEIEVDDYAQGAGGVLEIEIGGSAPGEYDLLTIEGTADLAGELRVMDIDDFVPAPGDAFVILTAAQVNGSFDTENVPAHYEVEYDATNVTLRFSETTADLNHDGRFDLTDYGLFQVCFAGSDTPPSGSCPEGVEADLDLDGDVDLDDFEPFYMATIGN